eukprot:4125086-Pleurochrysis_carterae.AAC.1
MENCNCHEQLSTPSRQSQTYKSAKLQQAAAQREQNTQRERLRQRVQSMVQGNNTNVQRPG